MADLHVILLPLLLAYVDRHVGDLEWPMDASLSLFHSQCKKEYAGGGGESLVDKGGIVILFICFSVGQTRWVRVILEFVILNFVMVLFELVGLCNMVLGKKPE